MWSLTCRCLDSPLCFLLPIPRFIPLQSEKICIILVLLDLRGLTVGSILESAPCACEKMLVLCCWPRCSGDVCWSCLALSFPDACLSTCLVVMEMGNQDSQPLVENCLSLFHSVGFGFIYLGGSAVWCSYVYNCYISLMAWPFKINMSSFNSCDNF